MQPTGRIVRDATPPTTVVTRLDRVTEHAVAFRFITAVPGMLDRPVRPGDDSCGLLGPKIHRQGPGPASSCFLFEIGCPFALAGERIHPCTVAKCLLSGADIFAAAGPGFLRRSLQRATVGEGHLPGQSADPVDGVK